MANTVRKHHQAVEMALMDIMFAHGLGVCVQIGIRFHRSLLNLKMDDAQCCRNRQEAPWQKCGSGNAREYRTVGRPQGVARFQHVGGNTIPVRRKSTRGVRCRPMIEAHFNSPLAKSVLAG